MHATNTWNWPVFLLGTFLFSGFNLPFCQSAQTSFSYELYGNVLQQFVNGEGLVNYQALKEDREPLDAFADALEHIDPVAFKTWSSEDKIAFWINAYNALTLKVIIDHYPIKKDWKKKLLFPIGIRHIPGVWDKITFPIMGRKQTLNEIENEILRKDFNEPRIHVALVCAAMSCPQLRREPYTGSALKAQLKDQSLKFLNTPTNFRIDPLTKTVYLSKIFEWFEGDFKKTSGDVDAPIAWGKPGQQAVVAFIFPYIDATDRQLLKSQVQKVLYQEYDWELNEQGR